jgi:rubrerythrin
MPSIPRRILASIGLACLLLALPVGCRQTPATPPAPSVTNQNLQSAYAKALNHSHMYTLFAQRAGQERNKGLTALYTQLARSEEIRANNHADLLRRRGVEPTQPPEEKVTVGNSEQTLKMAMNCEGIQCDAMYASMINAAMAEKDTAALSQLTMARANDKIHYHLLFNALNLPGTLAKAKWSTCQACGCVFDGAGDCPICKTGKQKIEKV